MNVFGILVAIAASSALFAAQSTAQHIHVETWFPGGSGYQPIGGSPFPTDTPINIPLGNVTGEVLVRITATQQSNGTLHDLGAVTITGTASGANALVSVIVASGVEVFPVRVDREIPTEGVRNVAGIVTSESLRPVTRVAVSASGNLTGPITVGHIRRLQFNGVVDAGLFTGGELRAAVTATAANGSLVTQTGLFDENGLPFLAEPLAWVRVAKKVTAPITALAGDIGTISIGSPDTTTEGLFADITAPAGYIQNIYCAGEIGDPADPAEDPRPRVHPSGHRGRLRADGYDSALPPKS